jgi:hypothetical protein
MLMYIYTRIHALVCAYTFHIYMDEWMDEWMDGLVCRAWSYPFGKTKFMVCVSSEILHHLVNFAGPETRTLDDLWRLIRPLLH